MNALLRPTVLVVDDDRSNRMILAGILQPECDVVLAKSGEAALRMMRENEDICLVLLDVTMPEMDGYEVMRVMKGDARTAGLPVVFITGLTESDDELQGFGLGAADYIFKPIRPGIVRARIRNLLKTIVLSRQLARSPDHDATTGLFGRDYFDQTITAVCALAAGGSQRLAVALVRIDGLNPLPLSEESPEVAQILGQIGRGLSRHGSRPLALAARYGPTDFALFLPDATAMDQVIADLRRKAAQLVLPVAASQTSTNVTLSVGVAAFSGTPNLSSSAVLDLATAALIEATAMGGNHVVTRDVA